ncbi:hypothetical protein SH1V18_11070 [Vallitalea longa]|uniref:Lipoprotein n=1 Tax=Vallitalea longa TaxID=2936439 RepID=A0A9W5Y7U5_9FIRM|nr:hypothetical protein [Vallitalea longa]GKX28627.1 hypothetical protein SH1V18_11070 [Vallitalea longa]
MKAKRLLILFCFILILSSCKYSKEEDTLPVIIMKEAKNDEEHYILYTDGENIILKNINEDSETVVKKCLESIKQVLVLPEIDINSDLPDPEDMTVYKEITPYTYEMSLESSAKHILALKKDGWSIIAEYANYLYRDIYMQKDKRYMRIIVLENKIKIFDNIGGGVPSPWLYINEK